MLLSPSANLPGAAGRGFPLGMLCASDLLVSRAWQSRLKLDAPRIRTRGGGSLSGPRDTSSQRHPAQAATADGARSRVTQVQAAPAHKRPAIIDLDGYGAART